jgi:hypothetical protein
MARPASAVFERSGLAAGREAPSTLFRLTTFGTLAISVIARPSLETLVSNDREIHPRSPAARIHSPDRGRNAPVPHSLSIAQ